MTETRPDKNEPGLLLKVLTAHFDSLVSARSDEELLREYAALLRFLRSRKRKSFGHPVREAHVPVSSRLFPTLNDQQLRNASLDDIGMLVNDEATGRKLLEQIAIERFSVPRGSMRSFSNKQILVDKLRTLIENERAHDTIGEVARGEGRQT
jgi:hypothetical protein